MSQRRFLTDFELMILLAILRVGEEAYGVPIAAEIEGTVGRPVARAAVYTALDRLEANGLVRSRRGHPTSVRGGRAKRYFQVTTKGVRAVEDTREALTTLWTGVPQLNGGLA
jgi:DNA-binding PadR family transcriptional regulator